MIRSDNFPILAFTLGDPGGIGPELIFRTLNYFSSGYPFIPVIFGSKSIIQHPFLTAFLHHKEIVFTNDLSNLDLDKIYFFECCDLLDLTIKVPCASNGFASYSYIKHAVDCIQSGFIDGLVTAPLCKESLQLADVDFTGHTTMLKSLTQSNHVSMAFHTSSLNVVLATIHIPLNEVSSFLTQRLLKKKVEHAAMFMKHLGKKNIKIAIAALNPHAGENAMFGTEEIDIITPFVENSFFGKGIYVSGPYPADTLFFRAYQGEFDCVIAMYHDQGLIPVKLIGFHEAVNVTLGLPFFRTSPDYGTAFDRAYEHLSSIDSMVAATQLASRLVKGV